MSIESNKTEFNSEFSSVRYLQAQSAVLLVWKKFCCFEDYRAPTLFALELLKRFKGRNFIIDARNGFEDEKADVEWGFSVLLPAMAKTDCKTVTFILSDLPAIEGEMNMWSKEFAKYFAVKNAKDLQSALLKTDN